MTRFYLLIVALLALAGVLYAQRKVTGYDLHVYFFDKNPQQQQYANNLMRNAMQWGDLRIKMFPAPIGPHPIPMFEIDIPVDYPHVSHIVAWIMLNRGN